MTPRIETLLARARERTGEFWQRRVWATESLRDTEGQPAPLRQAQVLACILRRVPALVAPGELLVGTHPASSPPDPPPAGAGLCPDIHALRSEAQRRAMRAGLFTSGIKNGHLTPDYPGLLREGFGGVLARVTERLAAAEGAARDELEAMALALRAAIQFCARHATAARDAATAADNVSRRDECLAIAAACERIAREPPGSLHEAVQLVWLCYLIQCCEVGESTGAFALGRFDQYLYPFWAQDLAAGRPREELLELVACLWVKLNEFTGLQVLNLTIGGSDAAGADCVNDLSDACLELMAELRTPAPSLSVRWHPAIDPQFMRAAVALATTGGGQPAFYGDPAARQAMASAGVAAADAADVVPGGCVELGIQGCCNPWVGNFFNLPKALELALHDGRDPRTGEQVGPRTGTPAEMGTFEDLVRAYQAQVDHGLDLMAASENLCDRVAGEYLPYPFLSALVGDCIARGRDITGGGARYNFTEDQGIGIAHVVDSLLNVRRMVFEQGEMSLPELVGQLDEDFTHQEALRHRLQRMRPAYGDGSEEGAALTREIVHGYFGSVERYRNPRGGPHRAGLLVWTLYHEWADCVGALPDGRRRGEALVSSIGPRLEAPADSPTSIILDATAFDHWRCAGALTLNLRFDAGSVGNPAGREAVEQLLVAYFERGGLQVQVNVVDKALLRQAREDPHSHAGLLVRVSGFVARFVELPARMQEEVIARAELSGPGAPHPRRQDSNPS